MIITAPAGSKIALKVRKRVEKRKSRREIPMMLLIIIALLFVLIKGELQILKLQILKLIK